MPVLDCEWFEDDSVARTREFFEVTVAGAAAAREVAATLVAHSPTTVA